MSSLDIRSIDVNQLRKQPCPSTKQEFRVFLSEAAFDRAVARGNAEPAREIGGVLVGELLCDDAGPYLRIDTTIDALHAEEKGAELTFTHATWEHIHKEMDGKHQDKRVVGWYHTHPDFGVFLSDRDQFIHKSFFNLPFQVAFVYDPVRHEHGMFTWHDNEVWRARRYWIGAREQVWDGVRSPGDAQDRDRGERDTRDARKAVKPRSDRDAERPQSQDDGNQPGTLGMLIGIGIIVLLVGGFIGHWFGAGSANQVLVEAQRQLDVAKDEGRRAMVETLQRDLLQLLRDTFSDEALRRPVTEAIGTLDQMIAALPPEASAGAMGPGSAAPRPAASGAAPSRAVPPGGPMLGPVAPGGPASGPAAPGAAGPGTGAKGAAATVAGPAAPGATAAGGTPDTSWANLAVQLKAARAKLLQLEQTRRLLQRDLADLAAVARRGNEIPKDVARDLAEQRAALGRLYAELASDAVKAGDRARARGLLAVAAQVDPHNRGRYEILWKTFDPSGGPLPVSPGAGAADQGAPR